MLWVDRVGCRRLWSLLAGLPFDSAFQSALRAAQKVAAPAPGETSSGWRALARRLGMR